MKPQRAFIAERALACHCPELLAQPPCPEELLPRLARLGERLGTALVPGLGALLGGEAPMVHAAAPVVSPADELFAAAEPLAAVSLLGIAAARLAVSIGAEPLLRLVDRAFGGRGEAPGQLPDAFPLSAELMIARVERLIAAALSNALGEDAPAASPLARACTLERLEFLAAGESVARIELAVTEAGGAVWPIQLVLPLAMLPALLDDAAAKAASGSAPAAPTGRASGAFAELPLTLRAVLVDMSLPMDALAGLEVGQVIPVAVARSIPLAVGGATIAHGTAGTFDDRIALRLTQTFT